MSLLRNLSWLFVLAIAFSTITVPRVAAQTTQILSVDYPSNANSGDMIHIVATVSYSGGYWVWANLIDLSNMQPVATSVDATPTPCGRSKGSTCGVLTNGGSGTVTFSWGFLELTAEPRTLLYDAQVFLSDSSPTPLIYEESKSHYHVSIQVAIESLTSSQQVPTSTTSQPAYDTPQLWLAFAIIAALAVLGALIIYSRRGKKLKTTLAKTGDSTTEKAASGKAFCIKCGKELPADWEFCRHCGMKQP